MRVLIFGASGMVSKNRLDQALQALIRPLTPLLVPWFVNFAATTERVGQAMLNAAAAGYPPPILGSADINIVSMMGNA